jgi:hypothetical protein
MTNGCALDLYPQLKALALPNLQFPHYQTWRDYFCHQKDMNFGNGTVPTWFGCSQPQELRSLLCKVQVGTAVV